MSPPQPQRIMEMASAFYESCVLLRAVEAGIFDFLARQAGSDRAAVAEACGLDPRAARLLLDACTALDLLVKENEGYRNGPEADAFLVSGRPADLSGALGYNREVYPLWGKLDVLLKSGRPVVPPRDHLGGDPERTRVFVMAMHSRALAIGRAVIPLLRLRGDERVLDLGGGSGAYSILAAQAYPGLQSVVLDLPAVVSVAETLVREAGLSGRVACHPGDYHEAGYPRDRDLVLLFGILHQESAEAIRDILARVWESLRPGGRVAVLDMMTDASRCRPKFSALFAINMALTAEHGWVFSDEDLRQWCHEAGFAGFECRPLPPPMPHALATFRKGSARD